MKRNRSIPTAVVIPVLIYPDVRAAVAWLTEAFGFEERLQIGEDHRSQMNVGDGGAVIMGDVRRDRVAPRPGESKPVVDIELARQNIDLLEMIREKTRNNLTPEEQKLLDSLLYETRMRFVEAKKQGK